MAAAAVGCGSGTGSWIQFRGNSSGTSVGSGKKKRNGFKVSCVSSSSAAAVGDPYKTLRIGRGASESEVKKAFRQLALQYHPDVCRGSDCGIQFHQIYEAYDYVMSNLREEPSAPMRNTGAAPRQSYVEREPMRGMNDPDWDMWEEWMGYEGGGVMDYSNHINPYI